LSHQEARFDMDLRSATPRHSQYFGVLPLEPTQRMATLACIFVRIPNQKTKVLDRRKWSDRLHGCVRPGCRQSYSFSSTLLRTVHPKDCNCLAPAPTFKIEAPRPLR